jgi:beta-glucosidase
MASYCEIDGIPSHANPWLLKEVLRDEWHYDGIVVSDWWAIDQLWQKHQVEPDQKHAAARAFNAGVTVDLPYGTNYAHLAELVKEGAVKMADLDEAVTRVLTLKFKLGLFDEGPIDLAKAKARAAREEGRVLARKAAEESMVLLKNDNNLLPLRLERTRKIALVGPCAATNFLGGYSIDLDRDKNVSLLAGLKARVGDKCQLLYAEGCRLVKTDGISESYAQKNGSPILPSPAENQRLIDQAVKVASEADVVICAVGESEQFSMEAGSRAPGDMSDLNLQSNQDELVRALVATGKPVVVYLMHGRPLTINWIAENVPAILDGWYCGEEAGTAFAGILFGDVNPAGKLTITVPRSVGQLPIYYNHKPSARSFDYVTEKDTPLFPFGYGLSYTTFKYAPPRLVEAKMKQDGTAAVEVDITNTGKVAGDEIVQLYIHQKVSSATRPVKELKDFARLSLKPGEKKTVRFALEAAKLAYWNAAMKYGVEPGTFEIMTGPSSVDLQRVELTVTE